VVTATVLGSTGFTGLRPSVKLPMFEGKKDHAMPGKSTCGDVGAKEQREYEHITASAEWYGRYGARAKKMAAKGHETAQKKGHRTGQ